MAGGFGKRLHPLTTNIPKPLIPVCGKPIMLYVIQELKKHSIDDIVVLLFHQPNLIKDYFKDGKEFGVELTYVTADQDFGTAGAVKYAQKFINEPFIVISADIITDFDLTSIIKFHKSKKAAATITLTRVENPLEYGIVITGPDGRINHFLEKPSWGEVFSDTVNTGIYILEPEVLDDIPEGRLYDFSMDLFPKMLEDKKKLFGCVSEGYWKDIGNLLEYAHVHKDILDGKIAISDAAVSSTAKVSHLAKIEGRVIIGSRTSIADGAYISSSVIGERCAIGRDAKIVNSVIWDDVEIGKECSLSRCVVADGAVIQERSELEEGSIVSEKCVVGADSKIQPYIRIWPGKNIEEGSIVNSSVIWRQRWSKNIFGPYGITGICNIEITPEFAAKLGSAFGAMLGKGSSVTSSMDGHKASRMISRGLISGLLSSGVNVSNLEMVPSPINRYELKALKSKGGIHVRKSPFDHNLIDIKFFDGDGMDLSPSKEKSIEKFFWGEDYERPTIDETGELTFPFYRVAEGYKEGLITFVQAKDIKDRKYKVIIDYSYGSASSIFPSILGQMGCDTVAINAYIDDSKFTRSKAEFDRSLKQLSQIVVSLKADLGILFDTGAEKIFLIDEKGSVLSGDLALSLMVKLMVISGAKTIAVPVNASSAVDEIASEKKVKVFRTKTSHRSMMETAVESKVDMFGENTGGYIFPGFQPSFDSMLSTAKLFELLLKPEVPMSEIVESLPKKYLLKDQVPCPNALKGMVIRYIVDEARDERPELIDGVKLRFGSDWVLVNGHAHKQEIYIISESDKEDTARKLMSKYKDTIKKLISDNLGKK